LSSADKVGGGLSLCGQGGGANFLRLYVDVLDVSGTSFTASGPYPRGTNTSK